jgi:hypothetical protein
LKKWTNLIQEMGKKYDGDEAVVLIQMAGLCCTGGEMHLPATPADLANWKQQGYSRQKLTAAWVAVIDAYADAFPRKYLGLNVSVPLHQDGVVEAVLAYARRKLGNRLCVQHNALAAKTNEKGYPHLWIADCPKDTRIGFQQLCPATPTGSFNQNGERFGGTLERSLQIGQRAGMTYLEVYKPDLRNVALRPTLEEYAKKMKDPTSKP